MRAFDAARRSASALTPNPALNTTNTAPSTISSRTKSSATHCPQNPIFNHTVERGIRVILFVVYQRDIEFPAPVKLVKPRQRQWIRKTGYVNFHQLDLHQPSLYQLGRAQLGAGPPPAP